MIRGLGWFLVLGVALWRGPPAPADAAVDGPLTRVEGALSALTGALERLQDFLDGMAASSLNDALGRAGIAARFDPGVEGQLLTQCRGLLTALANSVPRSMP